MKSAHLLKAIVIGTLMAMTASAAHGYWTDPNIRVELNDFQNGLAASRPTISADENAILFFRYDNSGRHRAWEARRNPDTGLFDQQRKLSELNNGGIYAYGYWMSEDNLRLYYTVPASSSVRQSRPLWMAVRENIDQPWQTVRRHQELEVENHQTACSLTADEKMIMYETADFGGGGLKRIFTATRNSIEEPFSNLQERYELEAIEAWTPTMTPDGLTVYFFRTIPGTPIENGQQEIWAGHRPSLDAPFGNFHPLDDINSNGNNVMGWASPSWDGSKLYVHQRNLNTQPDGPKWDLEATGIFVYHWVDPPAVMVAKNLIAAIENKHVILEHLTATIQMETETMHILDWLQEQTKKGSEPYRAIQKTKMNLQKSLQKQIHAQIDISNSISDLQNAMEEYPYKPPME